jgi:ATP:ADP antiporter, AAA family
LVEKTTPHRPPNRPVSAERPEFQSRTEIRATQSFPGFKTVGEAPKGGLERVLSYFADVRSGEGIGVVLLTLNVFLLLFSYYLLKTVREALILTEGGAYVKAYSSAGQAVLLMILVPLYGYVGTKINRIKLVVGLLAFFIMNLAIFYAVGVSGVHEGVAFYIWVGIFNVFVVSQFWALANDLYTEDQGKRLFAMIGVGSSLGAWLGAQAAERLVRAAGFTPYQIQLLGAAVLVVCGAVMIAANRVVTRHSIPEMARQSEKPLASGDGFALIGKSHYLALIAALVVLLNVVNSGGEFLLGKLVADQAQALHPGNIAAQQSFVGGFYGSFFAGVNLLGFLLQAFAVSRLFGSIGVRGTLYLLPSIALLSYSILAFVPVLGLVRIAKTLENATDYSINNTVRQALFLPTSREAKYKAKAAIDTFFMRFGDVLQAGVVKIGAELQLAFTGFAWINVGLTLTWLWVVSRLAKQHRQMGF